MTRYHTAIKKRRRAKSEEGVQYPEIDIREVWQEVFPEIQGMAELERLAEIYEQSTNPVWAVPDSRSFVRALREESIHLGVISNAQFYTERFMERIWGDGFSGLGFDTKLTKLSFEEGVSKPNDHSFGLCQVECGERGLNASEILFVGNDPVKDIAPARSRGWMTALYVGDERSLRSRGEDPLLQPDCQFSQYSELKKWIFDLPYES